jgi:AcrR family transcriptional regulator
VNRRERYREQTREEVKELALAQLAEAGAAGLSLNAIAKRMGLTGPALYRYFSSRDALLTELIGDGYDDLARALAEAAAADTTPEQRFRATAAALRAWAVGQPHRYLLLFGTPVPGFAAPDRMTGAAQRSMRVLMDVAAAVDPPGLPPGPLDAQLAAWQDRMGIPPTSPTAARLALAAWTRLHGILSLEVANQFTLTGVDPALIYEAEVDALLRGSSERG